MLSRHISGFKEFEATRQALDFGQVFDELGVFRLVFSGYLAGY